MGNGLKQLNRPGSGELESLTATELRVLHLLRITRRPLQSHELEGALAIAPSAVLAARQGLAARGFIAHTEQKPSSDGATESFWSLAK
ncbi:MAG: hypothetical protein WDO56_17635 [Gammaproteobacteria bacterium]